MQLKRKGTMKGVSLLSLLIGIVCLASNLPASAQNVKEGGVVKGFLCNPHKSSAAFIRIPDGTLALRQAGFGPKNRDMFLEVVERDSNPNSIAGILFEDLPQNDQRNTIIRSNSNISIYFIKNTPSIRIPQDTVMRFCIQPALDNPATIQVDVPLSSTKFVVTDFDKDKQNKGIVNFSINEKSVFDRPGSLFNLRELAVIVKTKGELIIGSLEFSAEPPVGRVRPNEVRLDEIRCERFCGN